MVPYDRGKIHRDTTKLLPQNLSRHSFLGRIHLPKAFKFKKRFVAFAINSQIIPVLVLTTSRKENLIQIISRFMVF